ncbi:EamA family transporter [Falsihalocynthiibacter sp. SS001]|uniref:EamA family transporter n=1 Tax=Falsihalocynthiibacter sp. SS001 TaxID=3349698 RepID=UPI0036D3B5FC
MSAGIFAVVLFAAFMHALWNAIVKGAGDKTIMLGLVALGHVVPGIIMVMISPSPVAAAIPYIIASTVIHWAYYLLLNLAYRAGDFSIIYPIARGLAPIMIALGAQIWVGEALSFGVWCGILAVSGGIMLLTFSTNRAATPLSGVLAAVGVAIIIAMYSIVDGIGVRLSTSTVGYIGWLFIAEIIVALYIFATRWERLLQLSPRTMMTGISGGLVSATAYGLVLFAKTQAPLGIVSALRETSVIFAAMIGVFWFSEGPRAQRIVAAVVVALGIATITAADMI